MRRRGRWFATLTRRQSYTGNADVDELPADTTTSGARDRRAAPASFGDTRVVATDDAPLG